MAGNRIDFTVGFKTDTSGLSQLQTALNNIGTASFGANASAQLQAGLTQAKTTATELGNILNNSFNVKTGQLDLTSFNKQLTASGMSLKTIQNDFKVLGTAGSSAFSDLSMQVMGTQTQLVKTTTLADKLFSTFSKTVTWGISSRIFNNMLSSISSAYSYVKELDSSLNDIRIVSGESAENMENFAKTANEAAKKLGASTTQYTNAALIYYRQGLEGQDVTDRTNTTVKMANVMGESEETVSDYMTAIWNNFDDGTQTLEYYGDALAALGASTATSAEEVATGLEKFASVSSTVGLSYEYASAAVATLSATTRQSADTIGTSLKTLFARIDDLEQDNTQSDGTSLGQYSQALANIGVNIKDESGNLRDMDTILDETASKWGDLTNAQKVALAQTVAGTRQYTVFMNLMNNWDQMTTNIETATNATGTLNEQQSIYMDSIQAKLETLQATWESLYSGLLNDDAIKTLLDGITTVASVAAKFVNSFGGGIKPLTAMIVLLADTFNKQLSKALISSQQKAQNLSNVIQALATKKEMMQAVLANDGSTVAAQNMANNYKNMFNSLQISTSTGTSPMVDPEQIQALDAMIVKIGELDSVSQNYATELTQINNLARVTGDSFAQIGSDTFAANLNDGSIGALRENLDLVQGDISGFLEQWSAIGSAIQNVNGQVRETDDIYKNLNQTQIDILQTAINEVDCGGRQNVSAVERFNILKQQYNTNVESYKLDLKALDVLKELIKSEYERNNIQNTLNTSIEQYKNNYDRISQKINTITSSMSAFAFGWSSANTLISTFNDSTKTTSEKITSILFSVSMLVPAVTKIIKMVTGSSFLSILKEASASVMSTRFNVAKLSTQLAAKQNKNASVKANYDGGIAKSTWTAQNEAIETELKQKQAELTELEKSAQKGLDDNLYVQWEYDQAIEEKEAEINALKDEQARIQARLDKEKAKELAYNTAVAEEDEVSADLQKEKLALQVPFTERLSQQLVMKEANILLDKDSTEEETKKALLLGAAFGIEGEITAEKLKQAAVDKGLLGTLNAKLKQTMAILLGVELNEGETLKWSMIATGLKDTLVNIVLPLLTAAAVIAGIVLTVKAIYNWVNRYSIALKKANENLETAKDTYDTLKDSLSDLTSALDEIREAQDTLSNLASGTEEWKDQLSEVNTLITDIISKYPDLAQYIITDDNGNVSLTEEGMDAYEQKVQGQVYASQIDVQKETANVNSATRDQTVNDYEKNFGESGWAIEKLLSYGQEKGLANNGAAVLNYDDDTLKNIFSDMGYTLSDSFYDALEENKSETAAFIGEYTSQTASIDNTQDLIVSSEKELLSNFSDSFADTEESYVQDAVVSKYFDSAGNPIGALKDSFDKYYAEYKNYSNAQLGLDESADKQDRLEAAEQLALAQAVSDNSENIDTSTAQIYDELVEAGNDKFQDALENGFFNNGQVDLSNADTEDITNILKNKDSKEDLLKYYGIDENKADDYFSDLGFDDADDWYNQTINTAQSIVDNDYIKKNGHSLYDKSLVSDNFKDYTTQKDLYKAEQNFNDNYATGSNADFEQDIKTDSEGYLYVKLANNDGKEYAVDSEGNVQTDKNGNYLTVEEAGKNAVKNPLWSEGNQYDSIAHRENNTDDTKKTYQNGSITQAGNGVTGLYQASNSTSSNKSVLSAEDTVSASRGVANEPEPTKEYNKKGDMTKTYYDKYSASVDENSKAFKRNQKSIEDNAKAGKIYNSSITEGTRKLKYFTGQQTATVKALNKGTTAWEDNETNMNKWIAAVSKNKNAKVTTAYKKSAQEIAAAYGDLFDGMTESDYQFVLDNAANLQKMQEGDTEAFKTVRKNWLKYSINKLKVNWADVFDKTGFDGTITDIEDALYEEEINPTITVGTTLDKGQLYDDVLKPLYDALTEAGYKEEEINDFFMEHEWAVVIEDDGTVSFEKKESSIAAMADYVNNGNTYTNSGAGTTDSSSSSDDSDDSQEEKIERETDAFREVNNEIEKYENLLSKMQTLEENASGKNLISNIKNQIQYTKQLNKLNSRKLDIAKQQEKKDIKEANKLIDGKVKNGKNTWKISGTEKIKLDDNGAITNYDDVINAYNDAYDKVVAKYNKSTDKDKKDKWKDEMSAIEDERDKIQKYMDDYEELYYSTIPELEEKAIEYTQEQLEYKIKLLNLEVDTRLDLNEAMQDWEDFTETIGLRNSNGKNILSLSIITDTDQAMADMQTAVAKIQDYASTGVLESTMNSVSSYANDVRAALKYKDNGDKDGNYKNSLSTYQENLKTYLDDLKDQLTDIAELSEQIEQSYLDTIDAVADELDEQSEMYENVADELDHNLSIIQSKYGEASYQQQQQYYDAITQNNLAKMEYAQDKVNLYYQKMIEAEEAGNQDAADKFKEYYISAVQDVEDAAEAAIEAINQELENNINALVQELEQTMTGTVSFDFASDSWELEKDIEDDFLDPIERAFKVDDLQYEYQKLLDSYDDDIYAQRKINSYMQERMQYLNDAAELSQADIDRETKRLALIKAEIALEEAQNNKSTLRLRRDSQGNYTYAYAADTDDVTTKTQELAKAKEDLYTYDKEQYQNSIDAIISTYTDAVDKIKEFMQSDEYKALTSEQQAEALQQRAQQLYESLTNKITTEEDAKAAFLEFLQSNGYDESILTEMGSSVEELIQNILNGTGQSLLENLMIKIKALQDEASEEITNVSDTTTGSEDSALKEFVGDDEEIISSQTEILDTASAITLEYQKWAESLTEVVEKAEKIASLGQTAYASADTWMADAYASESDKSTTSLKSLYNTLGTTLTSQIKNIIDTSLANIKGYDTGGYTGEWGSEGKLAVLHEKELVLNASDTQTILDAVEAAQNYQSLLAETMSGLKNSTNMAMSFAGTDGMMQQVNIEANFPGVSSRYEIEAAFTELINNATQYTNKNHK